MTPAPSLQQIVDRVGPLDAKRAASYVEEAARQLATLHLAGQFHTDIRPANIFLDETGAARLAAAAFTSIADGTIYPTVAAGIADFLAPERALNFWKADGRADIYSLGCVFYFLLVGRAPFASGSVSERLLMHQTAKPIAINDVRPDVPQSLADICETMMAKEPGNRYQSVDEVIDVIEAWRVSSN